MLTDAYAGDSRMRRVGRFLVHLVREWGPVIIAVLVIRSFLVESFMVPTGSMLETIQIGDFMLVNKFIYGMKIPFTHRTFIPVSNPKRGDIVVFRFPEEPDVPEPAGRFIRIFPEQFPLLPIWWDREAGSPRWYIPNNFVKRCVAVAGDTVEYRGKQLRINGRVQQERYVSHSDYRRLPGLDPRPGNFQQMWQDDRFFRTRLAPFVRDDFGPVVVPPGHLFMMGDNRDDSEDSRFWGPLPVEYVRGRPLVLYFSSAAVTNPPNIARILLSPWLIRPGRIGRIVR